MPSPTPGQAGEIDTWKPSHVPATHQGCTQSDALYYHFYENQEHKVAKHIGVRTDRYKLIYFYENGEWELYDLKKDQSEMKNVYGDSAYKDVVKTMKAKLEQLRKEYKDTEPASLESRPF